MKTNGWKKMPGKWQGASLTLSLWMWLITLPLFIITVFALTYTIQLYISKYDPIIETFSELKKVSLNYKRKQTAATIHR